MLLTDSFIDMPDEQTSDDTSEVDEDSTDSDSSEPLDDAIDSDDEVLQQMVSRHKETSRNPAPISVPSAVDISFHPDINLLAVGDIEGRLRFFDIDNGSSKVSDVEVHRDSVRSLDYLSNGEKVVSVAADGSLHLTDVAKRKWTAIRAQGHEEADDYTAVRAASSDVCVTGSGDGVIKAWDLRARAFVANLSLSEDGINDLITGEDGRLYAVTDGGQLVAVDARNWRKMKIAWSSEPHTSELTSCVTLRSNRSVVCASSEGELLLFDKGAERSVFKPNGAKREILSLVAPSEHIVIAGNECGQIIAYHLYPNQALGLIGQHERWDVSKLDLNSSGSLLASLAEDRIALWDISFLEDVEKVVTAGGTKRERTSAPLPSSQLLSRREFFSDLAEVSEEAGGDAEISGDAEGDEDADESDDEDL